jgi:hypothetical protein
MSWVVQYRNKQQSRMMFGRGADPSNRVFATKGEAQSWRAQLNSRRITGLTVVESCRTPTHSKPLSHDGYAGFGDGRPRTL